MGRPRSSPASGHQPAGALTDFQQRRLELADMLRAALPVAHAHRDAQREQEIRAVLARLAGGRFQLAVAGQFSRGKTTLMNALLGAAYLPVGALPTTSVVTTVRYGVRPRALVRSRVAGLPVEVPVTDVARFIAQASADRTRMQVASVEVEIPAELLRLGFEFVDTPGVGSAIAANTATTLRYLPQADAVIFVTSFDSALTENEADFLRQAAGHVGRIFLVINKRDLVTETTADQVTGYVRQWTRQNLSVADPQVFGLSALGALASALQPGSGPPEGGSIDPLRAALVRFLTAEQGKAALTAAARASANVLARLHRDMNVGRAAREGGRDIATLTAAFDARMGELQAEMSLAAGRIEGRVAAILPGRLAELQAAWQADLRRMVSPGTGSDPELTADGGLGAAACSAALAGRQVTDSWLAQRGSEVQQALIESTADDAGSLLDLARSPRELGAAMAGLPVIPARSEGWSADDLPELVIPQLEWVVPDAPAVRRLRHRRLTAEQAAAALSESLTAAVASFTQRAGQAFTNAADGWTWRLGEDASRRAGSEAAQVRHYLSQPPREGELGVIDDLRSQLEGYQESLVAWTPGGVPSDPSTEPEPGPVPSADNASACGICAAMQSALTGYLTRRQFLLATSEEEQARHADTGGFCPLHTWQYAHMASPVGIAAGNARLAGVIAAALRALPATGGTAEQLASTAGRLAEARRCPACAVLATAERAAAAAVACDLAARDTQLLCVRHLPVALAASPTPQAAADLITTLARALDRAAQDMRS